jgi:hypothetical protein
MSDKDIKNWIYKHYTIHRNSKIKLYPNRMEFKLRLGDCECDIPYPKGLIREIKLEKILC